MSEHAENTTIRIGVLTVSDRASRGEYEDKGGPAVIA
ncbi:MAG: molybdopterin adenylyltransferase, partial [Deltaproteobacteria bacterium]|nr:molybdopterin adenylyltransferase [Deltaproteobacteria bacterium]